MMLVPIGRKWLRIRCWASVYRTLPTQRRKWVHWTIAWTCHCDMFTKNVAHGTIEYSSAKRIKMILERADSADGSIVKSTSMALYLFQQTAFGGCQDKAGHTDAPIVKERRWTWASRTVRLSCSIPSQSDKGGVYPKHLTLNALGLTIHLSCSINIYCGEATLLPYEVVITQHQTDKKYY